MIIGNNNNEGAGFVPFSEEGPGDEALQEAGLRISCGVPPELRFVKSSSTHNNELHQLT